MINNNMIEFEQILEMMFGDTKTKSFKTLLSEDKKFGIIEMPVPGFCKDDIVITDKRPILVIKGESEEYGSFSKDIRIIKPERFDLDGIEAKVKYGMLKIFLPFIKKEQKKERSIPIK